MYAMSFELTSLLFLRWSCSILILSVSCFNARYSLEKGGRGWGRGRGGGREEGGDGEEVRGGREEGGGRQEVEGGEEGGGRRWGGGRRGVRSGSRGQTNEG